MRRNINHRIGFSLCLLVGLITLAGCSKSDKTTGGAADIQPASGAAEAAKRNMPPPEIQARIQQNTQAMEADSKRRSDAMAKAPKQ